MQYVSKRTFLDSLVADRQLTTDGKEWLTAALDPFHDYTHQIAGYPDADGSQTTVSCYQYQLDVAAPKNAGVPIAGNWDMHIYNMPQCVSKGFGVFNLNTVWSTQQEPTVIQNNYVTGLLNITTAASGTVLGPTVPAAAAATGFTTQVLPADSVKDLCDGITRVIAIGYEVTNTTSALNKQGAVTVYRMPQMGNDFQMAVTNNAGTFKAISNGVMYREPPATVAQANLLKGTRTWEAAEGVYATCFQNSVHNPLAQLESAQILYEPNSGPGPASVVRGSYFTSVGTAGADNTLSGVTFDANQQVPYDTTGAFFTGLSNSTTLTVKLKVYVERAPTYAEPSLAVLASPSAGYDVRALELYAAIINQLPVAVKVGENAKGDWWKAIVSVAKAVAAPAGLALNSFIPGASLVGTGLGLALGQIDTSRGKSVAKQFVEKTNGSKVKLVPQTMKAKPKKKTIRK